MFTDVMVDLETSGTLPDRHGVIQLAAVKFNLITEEIDHDFFDRCLSIPMWRGWSEGTRSWWMQQKRETLQEILNRAEPAANVLTAYVQWLGYQHEQPIRFWAKPIHFDWPFVASYLVDYDIPNPCHYRNARDVNSYIFGLLNHTDVDVPFQGELHNGIYDSLHQISLLFKAKEMARAARV